MGYVFRFAPNLLVCGAGGRKSKDGQTDGRMDGKSKGRKEEKSESKTDSQIKDGKSKSRKVVK